MSGWKVLTEDDCCDLWSVLVLSITCYFHYNIWGCRCSTGPFQYRWLKGYIYSSCYYHHQIGSIHLSHCYHIFPWLCAWDVCYIIFCHLLHIRSRKNGNLFSLLFWLADRIRLFVQYTISLSSLCKLIWRHWTYKMPVKIYFVECVIKIKHILSVIHYTICGVVCFQFTHFPCDDWENIYTLSYYHHQIGSMNYYPLFTVRLWNNGVRCMSFYILIYINSDLPMIDETLLYMM